MNRKEITNRVKSIILHHAQPVRIWLYGSEATGDAKKTSDIDIAYLDQQDDIGDSLLVLSKIKEDIAELNTLVSIDVSLLNQCTERFVNRVKTTGKVLYSNSKPLRAEDGLHNFEKALNRLCEVVGDKEFFESKDMADVYTDVVIKRFEFTFEMSWKAIKRVLAMLGLEELRNPRQCFKAAFSQGFITDEVVWLDMIEMRNLSSHTYDSDEISQIVLKIDDYAKAYTELLESLNQQL